MLKWIWRLTWFSSLIVTVAAIASIFYLVSTQTGMSWTIKTISALTPGLQISGPTGSWVNGIKATQVRLKNSATDLRLDGVFIKWDWKQLLVARIRLEQLQIEHAQIQLLGDSSKHVPTLNSTSLNSKSLPQQLEPFKLPVDLAIEKLSILRGQWIGGQQQGGVNNINATLHYRDKQWHLADFTAQVDMTLDSQARLQLGMESEKLNLVLQSPYSLQGELSAVVTHVVDAHAVNGQSITSQVQDRETDIRELKYSAKFNGPMHDWLVDLNYQWQWHERWHGQILQSNAKGQLQLGFDFRSSPVQIRGRNKFSAGTYLQSPQWRLEVANDEARIEGTINHYNLTSQSQFRLNHRTNSAVALAPLVWSFSGSGNTEVMKLHKVGLRQDDQQLLFSGLLNRASPTVNPVTRPKTSRTTNRALIGSALTGKLSSENFALGQWLALFLERKEFAALGDVDGEFQLDTDLKQTLDVEINKSQLRIGWLQQALTLTGSINYRPEAIEIKTIQGRVGDNQFKLAGSIGSQWQMQGDLQWPAVEQIWPQISAQGQAQFSLSGSRQQPLLDFSGRVNTLAVAGFEAKDLILDGQLKPLQGTELNLRIDSGEIGYQEWVQSQLGLKISGDIQRHEIELNSQGQLQVQGRWLAHWRDEAKSWRAQWLQFDLGIDPDSSLSLATPAQTELQWSPHRVSQGEICLLQKQQGLCLQAWHDVDVGGRLDLNLQQFELDWIQHWAQALLSQWRIEGRLSGQQTWLWSRQNPLRAEVEMQVQDLNLAHGVTTFSEDEMFQNLSMRWQLQHDQWRGRVEALSFQRGRLQLSANGPWPSQAPQQISLLAHDLQLNVFNRALPSNYRLGGQINADLKINHSAQLGFEVQGESSLSGGEFVWAVGELSRVSELNWDVEFNNQQASLNLELKALNGQRWASRTPWPLHLQEKNWQLPRACLHSDEDDEFCLSVQALADGKQIYAQLKGQAQQLLRNIMPPTVTLLGPVEGALSGAIAEDVQFNLSLSGQGNEVRLQAQDEEAKTWGVNYFTLAGLYEQRELELKGSFDSDGLGRGDLLLILPQGDQYPSKTTARDNRPLDLQVDVQQFQLQVLAPFIPAIQSLDGVVSVRGRVGGRGSALLYNGEMELTQGSFSSDGFPIAADDASIKLVVDDNQLDFQGHVKSASGGLDVSGNGTLARKDWYVNAQLSGQRIAFVQAPMFDVMLDPQLKLKMDGAGLFLTGLVDVSDGFVNLEKSMQQRHSVSADVVFVDQRETAQVDRGAGNFNMDIKVRVNELVKFRGPGVEGRLRGQLNLLQQGGQNRALGYFDLVEGRYFGVGPRLNLRRGRVDFRGDLFAPELFMEAVREVEDVVVGVRLSGRVDQPQIRFFSEPSMADDKILIYLFTGKPPGEAPPDFQSLANQALLSLSIAGGEGYAQSLARKLGVHDLEISANTSQDESEFNIGGYLSSRVYVQYGRNLSATLNSFVVRYRVQENLFLEAISGLESSLDVLYTFEF